jgi:NAD-dependent deacetylase
MATDRAARRAILGRVDERFRVDEQLGALAGLIRERQPVVALTGAGASTASGIPDFRSPTGWWAPFDPQIYSNIEVFRRDPALIWEFHGPRMQLLADAEPNPVHRALARLEAASLLAAIVTQNIDMLHEKAGSRTVIEVHGSVRSSSCRRCGRRLEIGAVVALVEAEAVPTCPGCSAVLKPDVVFFGEQLPPAAIARATELVRGAGLLLVIGSSLQVWPVAELPAIARAGGAAVAIVNEGPTSFDAQADLRIGGDAASLLAALADMLCA